MLFNINLQLFAGEGLSIYQIVTPKEIAVYYSEDTSNKIPYLGMTLFPADKQLGLDLKWIKGSKGLPVALKPSAFDVETTLRDRIGFDELETEMPFFKEGTLIKEKDRQELNKILASGNQAYIDMITKKIFDDVTGLIDGAEVQGERMIMQLLANGTIAIRANKVNYEYDYKFPIEHKETLLGTDAWSDAENSDPVSDIEAWQDKIEEDTGEKPSRAICTKKTWNYIKANKKIRLDMNPIGGQNIIMTDKLLEDYLENKLGLKIARYNKKYKTEAGVSTQFFPDNTFTLIPDGNLGTFYYGTTPEESDLMSGQNAAEVQIVNTGVAITTQKKVDPVNVFTKVSAVMLPSFESIDSVFIANVA
ncbi:phage capsid protein [Anaeromicrobium sediminis]|uniref:Phage capsid protein n=2 Tax=Anaeromicrobium sediminis TaxID=1478221 RepID=A0A267MP84_9FIRM|nr:phage capsid protein [Anaeromicrobium sediminis]